MLLLKTKEGVPNEKGCSKVKCSSPQSKKHSYFCHECDFVIYRSQQEVESAENRKLPRLPLDEGESRG